MKEHDLTEFVLTPKQFAQRVKEANEMAQGWVNLKTKIVPPTLIIWSKKPGEKIEMVINFMNEAFTEKDKYHLLQLAGEYYRKHEKVPVAAALLTEAWFTTVPASQVHRGGEAFVPPSEAANRREVAVLFVMSLNQQQVACSTMPILRDEEQRIFPSKFRTIPGSAGSPLLEGFFRGFFNTESENQDPNHPTQRQ